MPTKYIINEIGAVLLGSPRLFVRNQPIVGAGPFSKFDKKLPFNEIPTRLTQKVSRALFDFRLSHNGKIEIILFSARKISIIFRENENMI